MSNHLDGTVEPLDKTVSDDSHSGYAGQVAGTSTWTVTATKTIAAPYGWLVTGKIYIHNPATIPQTFSVSDVLDDTTTATVTCPSYTVPAGGDVECSYTASPADGSATLNTATLKAEGNAEITAKAAVSYGSIHVGSETAVLEDGLYEYKETINQTTILTWDQTFSCSDKQSDYTNGWYDYDVTNTATLKFGEETLTKNVTVGVDCTPDKLTATKDVTATYKQDITWTLDKIVSDNSHSGSAGQDAGTSTWTVTATKTYGTPYGWQTDYGKENAFSMNNEIKEINSALIINYFKVAFRKIRRQPGYTIINVFGVGIGLACCGMMMLWVKNEKSFDSFHSNRNSIYRLIKETRTNGMETYDTRIPFPLAEKILEKIPEVKNYTRYQGVDGWKIIYGDKFFYNDLLSTADSTFFDIFTFPFLKGDPKTALKERNSIVMTESMARKYFGTEEPLGKVLSIKRPQYTFTVTGVMKDVPKQQKDCFACHLKENLPPFASADQGPQTKDRMSIKFMRLKDTNAKEVRRIYHHKLHRLSHEDG